MKCVDQALAVEELPAVVLDKTVLQILEGLNCAKETLLQATKSLTKVLG